ncbi:UPF0149 family protein [Desulfuromonas sp. AOP6]|uniref:YecA/YgfB family protein n=1 Tax=Desulfuromonas sp. AOP6 TaxID=1566351 RepID=UPI0012845033|nr:UPF0149 family protein [Desulfuromonas sp. AOP6]BCA79690.1 hypothetical protein AOP6_1477 [Desulfuromonas sp. AOP6]
MLTENEKRALKTLLDHAVDPKEAMCLDQLEGYLFGLAITPDSTEPGEWFADIFGESLAAFPDSAESDRLFATLTETILRLQSLRKVSKLDFPFDLALQKANNFLAVKKWASGLDKALARRAYLWMPEEVLEKTEMDEDREAIMNCLLIVLGVAHPEKLPEMFEGVGENEKEIMGVWNQLLDQLALAVESLQDFADFLQMQKAGGAIGEQRSFLVTSGGRTGRNDPCPCRSGKKYKKCCGLN